MTTRSTPTARCRAAVPARRPRGRHRRQLRASPPASPTRVELCLFDDDGARDPPPAADYDAGRLARLRPGRRARPGLRLPRARARTIPRAGCAATRPSCCSTPTPARSSGEVRFGPEVLGYDAGRPGRAQRARLGRPRAAQPGRRRRVRLGADAPAPAPLRRHRHLRGARQGLHRARTRRCPAELRGTYAGLATRPPSPTSSTSA